MTKFFMGQFFAGGFFMSFRAARLGYSGRLDRRRSRHIRMPFRRRSLGCVGVVSIGMIMLMIMGVIIMAVIVLMMRMVVLMRVRMLMLFMVMMLRIAGIVLAVDVRVCFLAVKMIARLVIMVMRQVGRRVVRACSFDHAALDAVAIAAAARVAVARAAAVGAVFGLFFGFAVGAFVRLDQRLAIGDRDLIIVRMDFAERQKAVAVAAIFDEGGLQRRLYARHLGEIDISTQLLALGSLEIKLFDTIAADHNDPGLFRVGGID
jgi:hypothetical protein